jgi:membrane protein YdbS with pleckstrin-like domain
MNLPHPEEEVQMVEVEEEPKMKNFALARIQITWAHIG